MNISLKNTKKTKPRGTLGFGLNNRSTGADATPNVFGGDEDEDDDNEEEDDGNDNIRTGDSARKRINQQISKEQAALRQRAQAAMSGAVAGSIYDYDGAYDSFQETAQQQNNDVASATDKKKEERKSRYIGNLLETAKKRQREREAVNERKIAQEQALEDAQEDFAGKEKFITKAYRRKLEERKQWQAEEEARQKEEEVNDVTKQTQAGAALASFYGNFAHNVAMGGGDAVKKDDKAKENKGNESDKDFLLNKSGGGGMGFLAGFERSEVEPAAPTERGDDVEVAGADGQDAASGADITSTKTLTVREKREQKVAAARIRYLKRKGMAMEQ